LQRRVFRRRSHAHIALVVGLLALGVGLGLLLAYGGHRTPALSGKGCACVPTVHAFFWTPIALMMLEFLIATISVGAQVVAWIRRLVPDADTNRSRWPTDPVWRLVQSAPFTDALTTARRLIRREQHVVHAVEQLDAGA
jgi:hypothetical protein